MKEIGGFFGLEQLISNEYHKELIALNNGRNCLLYLLKARNIKRLYIPYFLCNSVRDTCSRASFKYEYYHIDTDFMPVFDKKLEDDEYLYVVNYYGQITVSRIYELQKKHKRIIIDNTQDFFQIPMSGVDTLYSCRKFFGVPDGGYLSTNSKLDIRFDEGISLNRMRHILGRYEDCASFYYNDFKESEESLDNEPLQSMSRITHNILGAIDYEYVCQVRNDNYNLLASKLDKVNKLKIIPSNGAFAYPLYMENGIEIKKNLAQKKIYIPTLWPNVLCEMEKDSIEYDYAANILPLPCDQRYAIDDMEYIISEVEKWIK